MPERLKVGLWHAPWGKERQNRAWWWVVDVVNGHSGCEDENGCCIGKLSSCSWFLSQSGLLQCRVILQSLGGGRYKTRQFS